MSLSYEFTTLIIRMLLNKLIEFMAYLLKRYFFVYLYLID